MGMGWILKQLYLLLEAISPFLGNYAIAIVLFTILVNLVFLPVNINQQKTMAKQTAIRPKMDALKEKCGDDRQKYSMELQALNQREGVKMMGGCLPQLIRLPFLWGVWMAIRSPLSYILNLGSDIISSATAQLKALAEAGTVKLADVRNITELDVVHHIKDIVTANPGDANAQLISEKVTTMDFNLFGINLTETPAFTFNFSSVTGAQLALWIIPLLSFATAMLSSIVSLKMQKKTNPDAASMGGMMLLMPLLSLWIAFKVPAAVGFYWACSNVVTMVIQVIMNRTLGPYKIIARNEAKIIAERRKKETQLKLNVAEE